VALRWRCLEVGCNAVVSADSEDELVEAANDHVRDAHDSYELEEVILAGAVETTTEGSRR
jgi:predicted small metal-binding protein